MKKSEWKNSILKSGLYILITTIIVAFFVTCSLDAAPTDNGDDNGGGGGSTITTPTPTSQPIETPPMVTMNKLPGRYSLTLPDSLKPAGTRGKKITHAQFKNDMKNLFTRMSRQSPRKTTRASRTRSRQAGETSFGYEMLKLMAQWVESNNKYMAENFVVMDTIFGLYTVDPSSEYYNEITIDIDTEILNKIKEYDPDYSYESTSVDDPGSFLIMDNGSGPQATIPFFYYLTSTEFNSAVLDPTVNVTGYEHLVMLNYYSWFNYYDITGIDPFYVYILWTNAKDDIKVIFDWASPTAPFRMEMYYNLTKNIAGMIYTSEDYPYIYNEIDDTWIQTTTGEKEKSIYSIIVQGKTLDDNGIMIKSVSKTISSEKSDEFILEGYINDDGGYCMNNFVEDNYKEDVTCVMERREEDKYKEQFDGAGTMTGWQYYDDSVDDDSSTGWVDYYETDDWTETTYDDTYDTDVTDFGNDIAEAGAEDPVTDNLKSDQHQVTFTLPSNVEWDETNDEVKKTFAITKYNEPPLPDGSNIVGYQTVTKEDYEKTPDKPVSVLLNKVDPEDTRNKDSFQLYEVEYNKVDIGTTSPNTIVNVAVKGAVEIVKAASGLFDSAESGIKPAAGNTVPIKVQVPAAENLTWDTNEKKLLVITNDGNPPNASGSNVLSMKRINQDAASEPGGIQVPIIKDFVDNTFKAFVFDSEGEDFETGNPQFNDVPEIAEDIADANGDGDFDSDEQANGEDADGDETDDDEDPEIPSPENLSASTDNPDFIEIKWDWEAGTEFMGEVDGFKIYYKESGMLISKFLVSVGKDERSFQDKKATKDVDRTYFMTAYIGELLGVAVTSSENSDTVVGKMTGAKPPTPTTVAASDTSTDGIEITWSCEDNTVDSYDIYRRVDTTSDVSSDFVKIKSVDDVDSQSESYVDVNVEAGKKYYYKIKSKNESKNTTSEYSLEDPGEIARFAAPLNVAATDNTTDKIIISWDEVTGADFYIIYRALTGQTNYTQIAFKITGTSYADTSAKPYIASEQNPIQYDYYVTAAQDQPANESDKSTIATGKRVDEADAIPAPKGLSASNRPGSDSEVLLSWDPLEKAPDNLVLFYSDDSGATWHVEPQNQDLKDVTRGVAEKGGPDSPRRQFKLLAYYPGGVQKESNVISVDPMSDLVVPVVTGYANKQVSFNASEIWGHKKLNKIKFQITNRDGSWGSEQNLNKNATYKYIFSANYDRQARFRVYYLGANGEIVKESEPYSIPQ